MSKVRQAVIVDDSFDLCDAFAQVLAVLGVESVVCATSLQELEQQATPALAADLAILDINLGPEQPTGLDVRRWLEAHGFAGKAVFLTGHARSHPLVLEALDETAGTVLQKPIDIDDVAKLLEEPDERETS